MGPLDGKTAVVTGAGGAMGRAAARALAMDGARVALLDVNAPLLEQSVAAIGGAARAFTCDVSDSGAVREAHERVRAQLGDVAILVNNAGVLTNGKAESTTDDEWRRVLASNLDGAFFWSRAVLPSMKAAGWGRIVNVGSLAAKTGGLTAGTAYAASKGAIASLTFSLARELAQFGITVNAIAPAYVNTPMVTGQLTQEQRRMILSQIPVGRFCEPEEFAHAVRFLAAPLAGFITGEVLDLNGGLLMD
jgi:3-oxoacyl-[acyl-carrier protein] reductase